MISNDGPVRPLPFHPVSSSEDLRGAGQRGGAFRGDEGWGHVIHLEVDGATENGCV